MKTRWATLSRFHKQRYSQWSGRPNGLSTDRDRCAAVVYGGGSRMIPNQCRRKRGHGPEEAFCWQHANKK